MKKIDKPLFIIVLFYLFFSFFMIAKFPKVWIDDSWNSVAPYALVTEGRLANPVLKGVNHRDQHSLIPTIMHSVLLAAMYKLFGFGLVQSRALSIFAGFFLVLLTYWFAKSHYDKEIATLAIILLVVDNVFFVSVRTVRADIFVALFGTAAFFFLCHGLQNKSLKYFTLSGISMGISLYTHPNSVLILISILLIFLYRFKLSIIGSKEFWTFSFFSLIAFSPYAIYVIKEDYNNNFSHFMAQLGGNADYLNRNYLTDFLGEYGRYVHYIYFPKRILIFLIQICALVYAFISKRNIDRLLGFMVLVFVLLLPLWNPHDRTSRYFIVSIPAITILLSALLIDLFHKFEITNFGYSRIRQKVAKSIMSLALILYFINHAGGDMYILWKHRDNDFNSFISEIRETIPKGSRVWGSMTFWMGLRDYPYITEISPFEEVEKFRPEYAILYDSMNWGGQSTIVARTNTPSQGFGGWDSIQKIEEIAKNKGSVVRRIDDKFYGNIHVYKIHWRD